MKKIILGTVLVICLTGCGNREIKENILEDEIKKEALDIISSVQDDFSVKENVVEEEIPEEEVTKNVVAEKSDESVTEDVKSDENKEEQKDLEVVSNEEKIIYEDGVEVGKRAIDFEVELLSGEKVKLSDFFGKPIFLNFWATWCGPCVGEMPDIEKIKNEYGDKLYVLAINGGELKVDVETFINRKGYTFNIGLDESGRILEAYDSMYIPLSIFIDKNGIIQERYVGALSEEKMKEIVSKLIEE